ncbi:MAG TPA: PAS domain S-box protein, partial [Anaerolineales bacterium]|nr:PAS domain S-box protein [Anaerolineales bacterium]
VLWDITERMQAEIALRLRESYLTAILENQPGLVWLKDADSRFLAVNRAFALACGKSFPEELVGLNDLDIWPRELAESYRVDDAKVMAARASIFVEEPIEDRGKRTWFETFKTPVFDGQGSVIGTTGFSLDISQRKQAELLQQAVYQISEAVETTGSLEELYPKIHQSITSVMPAEDFYIALYDAENDLLTFPYFRNPKDEAFIGGIHPGRGATAYVLRTGKSLLCTPKRHAELVAQGELIMLGVPSAIWLGVPLIVDGQPIGVMVVQHYSDPQAYGEREQHMLEFVSTQVALAISRKRAEEQLRYQASLLNRVNDAIVVSDTETRLIFWNAAAERLYGWKAQEVLGRKIHEILDSQWPGVESPDMWQIINKLGSWRGEVTQARKDGSRVPIEMSTLVPRDADGKISAYISVNRNITERKLAEQALQESEQKYRTLVESANEGITITQEGNIVFANRRLYDLLGVPDGSLQGKDFIEYVWPEDRQWVKEAYQNRLAGEIVNPYDCRITGADRQPIWVYLSGIAIQWNGKPATLSFMTDITERKKADEAVRASEVRYRGLFEHSPVALWEEDFSQVKREIETIRQTGVTDFRAYFTSHPKALRGCVEKIKVLDVNSAALALMHAGTKQQLTGNLTQVIRVKSDMDFVEELVDIAAGKAEFSWEGNNYTLDGQKLVVSMHWSAAPGYADTLARALVSIIDITERKLAEQTLRENEEKYRNLFNNAEVGMFRTRLDGSEILEFNDKYLNILGYTRDEVIGRPSAIVWADKRDRLRIERMLKAHGQVTDFESTILTRQGERRICNSSMHLYRDQGIVEGSIIDITGRKQAEELIQQLNASLEQR